MARVSTTHLRCASLLCRITQLDGMTPVHAASENGFAAVVKALIHAGAALDQAKVCGAVFWG
jgi:hypothetical protein